jgi:hypothetical protein
MVFKERLISAETVAHLNRVWDILKKKQLNLECKILLDRLCGLVVRVLGYRSGGLGSIPGTTRKKIYRVCNGVHSAS